MFFSRLFTRNNQFKDNEGEFPITSGMPLPIKNVNYIEQLRIVKTLERLPIGSSFPIKSELEYTVRKMSRDHFPEYKITIRNFGNSHRVFRVA